jgi:hypothetical protein
MKILRCFTLLIAALSLLNGLVFAQMSAPAAISPSQFATASTGQTVTIAVRVISLQRSALRGQLLDPGSGSTYKATSQHADLFLGTGTPIVMGSMQDVKPGAVLVVEGVVTGRRHADVKRIVVLTGYVKVE